MATKDCFLSFKDEKQQSFSNAVSQQAETNNLNLNQFNKCSSNGNLVTSISNTNDNHKSKSNEFENVNYGVNDKLGNVSQQNPSEYLNLHSSQELNAKSDKTSKNSNSNAKNSSTLSLHIAAYENAIEKGADDNKSLTDGTATKTKKNIKQYLLDDTISKNYFEFPRQMQDDQEMEPEVMQFKASQKMFNPGDDEADKENRPSGSQKSTQQNSPPPKILTKEERQERMPIQGTITYVCDRIDALKLILKEEGNVQKLKICVTDYIHLCRFVEGHFINFEMGDDLENPETMRRYIIHAGVVTTFVNLIVKKLPTEVLIWIISVYIDRISKRPFGDRLSGTLMDSILTYSKHLPENFREKLAEQFIDQWVEKHSDSNTFCLNEPWMKHFYNETFGFDLFPIKIEFDEGDCDRKILVLRSVLQLFLYGSFDFSQLPDEKLGFLFLCLIKDAFSLRISNLIISLLHKLICADLCNGIFLLHTLDIVFSFLEFFHREQIPPGSLEAQEKPVIENAVKSCLDKIASIIILPSDLKQLSLCKPSSFLPYTDRALKLLLDFQLDNPTMLKFVVNSLKNFKSTDSLGDYNHLPDSCKNLLRFLIVQCAGKNVDPEYISEMFLFVIKYKGDDNTSTLIDNLLRTASTNGKTTTVCISVRQTLINTLSPLSNAKQLLVKVVPGENEIKQLIQDLQAIRIDAKYLSTSFDIIAKSADFYSGTPETLLSFLSLPWICDMEWQIWEDFKKALPLLVPIKADEDKYKKLLSTSSLKALSLKALSQLRAKDQWRSFIFKEALYSGMIDVQMAALDALPYILTTIPAYPFFDVLTPLIENLTKEQSLTASLDLISTVHSLIRSISRCICVSGNQYTALPNKEMSCNLCQTKEGNRKTVRVSFSAAAFNLFTKIVQIEEEENELKIDFVDLISAAVRHIQISDEDVERLILLSLPLISASTGISDAYLIFIGEAIKSNITEPTIHSLHEQIYHLDDHLLQLDYFIVCALNSVKADFASNCVLEVIGKSTVRSSRNSKALERAISMVKVLAERENVTPRTFFIRNFASFCDYIIKRLLNSLVQLTSDENIAENEHKVGCDTIIEYCFASMAIIFEISSKKDMKEASRAFVNLAKDFLLPPLFCFKKSGTMDQTPYFEIILVKICEILNRPRTSVVTSALPRMIWFLCYYKNTPWNDFFFHRVEAFSHGFIATMVKVNYCKCCVSIILSMGKNEESAKMYLQKIYDAFNDSSLKPYEFTEALKHNYLGILLELRRTFSDEMYYYHRHDIIKALTALINNLETKYLSKTPGRMLSVLKAATPVELSLDTWMAFLQRMDQSVLENQIQNVLIAAAPLIDLPGARKIFEYIFNVRKKADPMKPSCQRFDRAVFVLYSNHRQFMLNDCKSVVQDENPLYRCSMMLIEEAPDVHEHVLSKILHTLDKEELTFDIFDELIHALLQSLKVSTSSKTRQMIGICIGKIGAIDPGKIGENSKNIDRRPLPLKFVDKPEHFFEILLELCGKLLAECSDATKVDFIAMSVQLVLKELVKLKDTYDAVFNTIKKETKNEVTPYLTSKFKFNMKETPSTSPQPYVDHSSSYGDWLWKWYFAASEKVKNQQMNRIFSALHHIYYTGDTKIIQSMIPQVVLQGLLDENNTAIVDEALVEIFGVFKKALKTDDGWIRMAAQACFQLIEFIEKFQITRDEDPARNKGVRERVQKFLKKAVGELREETGELLSVTVAEKYNFACRALRWLEQYGIKVSPAGSVEFNRAAFYGLERIYLRLADTDGVLGAYEIIQNHITASPQERVVACEATGDHTEALPLYQQNPVQPLHLIKCLLRLDQPLIAYTLARSFAAEENDEKIKNKLRDYQIEAAYRREEWENMDKILKATPEASHQITTWGAHIASVFGGIHDKSKTTFETRIDKARMQVMDSLKAVTMEGADTYSQAYRYIQRLHILYEIEDAAETMKLFETSVKPSPNCNRLIEKWDTRSDNAIQCSSILEPIYWVRRELLRFADPVKNKDKIAHYLVESSKLSRQANHLSTSWAHLINARSLGAEKELNVDMEEARYFFQRGQKGEAICSLQKTLEKHFPHLVEKLKAHPSKNSGDAANVAKKAAEEAKLSPQDRTDFVNTQLQLTSFMDKSNSSNVGDIYLQYSFMDGIAERNEQHAYSFAVFYDNAYYCRNPEDLDNVYICVSLYLRVLSYGRRYLLHVMPRLLTIWLNFASAMHQKAQEHQVQPKVAKNKRSAPLPPPPQAPCLAQKVTDLILRKAATLNKFYFLTAYPQLISSLCHPSDSVFKALETIIVEIMMIYPHECLWQTVSSYRTNPKEDRVRFERTKQVVKTATNKSKGKMKDDFNQLVQNYATLAELLIEVAEEGGPHSKHGSFDDFNRKFFKLSAFLRKPTVKITIPFITMVEKKMPTFLASQISLPDNDNDSSTVYLKGIEDKYRVYSSLERPKHLTMIGSNGKRYQVIAKRNDELRKDARCLDFCRMVNTLLLRDSEARRRQLHIRTYSVIPLQNRGGLIEVVPNITPLRDAFLPKDSETGHTMSKWGYVKDDKNKRRKFYDEVYAKNPVRMAEYLRKKFVDPCKWYAARLAFTRTAATMSMVGFILGLGDRHCENILLDQTSGEIVHVDFNILFNRGEDLPTPEIVPFRLTRNMIDGFGPTGVEGTFRKTCETVMQVLRQEQATLCTVLETFIHDPLIEWTKTENRNQQARGAQKNAAAGVVDHALLEAAISLIKARLEGKIVTKKIYPLTKSSIPMSVEGQVAQLIKMASDPQILEEMYIGWAPYL